jgi:uncharacterized radical SAM superfamily Fe-S cluster-containing enzyme
MKNDNIYHKKRNFIFDKLRSNIEKEKKLPYIEVHLNEHCNLNCAHCLHFCPLAEEEYYNLDEFEEDFKRLAELTKSNIKTIHLLGEKPLLNKDVNKFMKISREYFSNSTIAVVTNGILLLQMEEKFWETCQMCSTIAYIEHFNRYFNKNLQVTDGDFVDIHKIKDIREILEYLAKPCDFCRYCDNSKKTDHRWRVSKKEINKLV